MPVATTTAWANYPNGLPAELIGASEFGKGRALRSLEFGKVLLDDQDGRPAYSGVQFNSVKHALNPQPSTLNPNSQQSCTESE